MKLTQKLIFSLAFCSTIGWISCDNCRLVDCEGNETLILNYINADSTQLLTASDSISFIPLLIDNSRPVTAYLLSSGASSGELFVRIDENLTGFVVQLNVLTPDTVYLQTQPAPDSECCDKKVALEKVKLNGVEYPASNFSHLYIVK
jgi:hypothetical protein